MKYIDTLTGSGGTETDRQYLPTVAGTQVTWMTDGRVIFQGPGSYLMTLYPISYLARLRLFELLALWIQLTVVRDRGNGWDRWQVAGYGNSMSRDQLIAAILERSEQ